jgi:DNA-binding FadR family transcriptional regulator
MIEHGVHTDQISIQQIYDVRRTIETRIVRWPRCGGARPRPRDRALARAMREARREPERLMERDLDFHSRSRARRRNPVFALIVGAFQGITRQTWPIGWRAARPPRRASGCSHARGDRRRVAAGDPARAAEAMERHFDESVRRSSGGGRLMRIAALETVASPSGRTSCGCRPHRRGRDRAWARPSSAPRRSRRMCTSGSRRG